MELEHLPIFVEVGLHWMVQILYKASEKNSPCRIYMDSYNFREFYIKHTLPCSSFDDVINMMNASRFHIGKEECILQFVKEGNWDMVKIFLDSILRKLNRSVLPYQIYEVISEASCNPRVLWELFDIFKLYCGKFFITINESSSKMYYKLALLKIPLPTHLTPNHNIAATEEQDRLLAQYIPLIPSLKKLAYYHSYFQGRKLDALAHISSLVNLNTVEGRRKFHQYEFDTRYKLSAIIDCSTYISSLYACKTSQEYKEYVNLLEEEHSILLTDLPYTTRIKLKKFANSL